MSKRKRRKPFSKPSQTLGKYIDKIDKAESLDTSFEMKEREIDEVEPTDSGRRLDDTIGERRTAGKRKNTIVGPCWKHLGRFVLLVTVVGVIWRIGWYFGDLNSSVKTIKKDVQEMSDDSADFTYEYGKWKDKINESFTIVKERVSLLMDDFHQRNHYENGDKSNIRMQKK